MPAFLRAPRGTHALHLAVDAADPEVCRNARSAVRQVVDTYASRATRDDVVLVASELLANAVRHGGPPVQILVQPCRDETLVAVSDSSERVPLLHHDTHRGLNIVGILTGGRWGVSLREGGKWIWAKVPHIDR